MTPTTPPRPPLVIPPELQPAADELARALAALLAQRWVRAHAAQQGEQEGQAS